MESGTEISESLPPANTNVNLVISTGFSSHDLLGSIKGTEFYKDILDRYECTNFAGFEVIGWLPVLPGWKDSPLAFGIHGRCAISLTLQDLITFAADQMIISTPKLIERYGHLNYILIHDLEAERNIDILKTSAGKIKTLFIENTPEEGSLDKSLQLIQTLQAEGVNAGLMFDLVHYLAEIGCDGLKPGVNEETWNRMILSIDTIFNSLRTIYPKVPLGIHLPIGVREGLPLEDITDEMWKQLACITQAYELVIVIEKQEALSSYFSLGKSKRFERIKERTCQIIRELRMCEVI